MQKTKEIKFWEENFELRIFISSKERNLKKMSDKLAQIFLKNVVFDKQKTSDFTKRKQRLEAAMGFKPLFFGGSKPFWTILGR